MDKVIALNLKTYAESSGASALKLARTADKIAAKIPDVQIIIATPIWELSTIARAVSKVKVFGQHADANDWGAFTGSLPPAALKQAGAFGTLLNHAEKKLPYDMIQKTLLQCRKTGLKVLACAKDVPEGEKIADTIPHPEWIAVEPPELIGTGVSVSTAQPDVVRDAVRDIKEANAHVQVLVGAGVSNAKDVGKCFELGASGVLLASAFVKSQDPEKLLLEMANAASRA